jgi:hypothetical protein
MLGRDYAVVIVIPLSLMTYTLHHHEFMAHIQLVATVRGPSPRSPMLKVQPLVLYSRHLHPIPHLPRPPRQSSPTPSHTPAYSQ